MTAGKSDCGARLVWDEVAVCEKHGIRCPLPAPALDVERLREAAQAILDRCLDVFDPDDLDPESSFAMPVTLKARWVYALRAALVSEEKL